MNTSAPTNLRKTLRYSLIDGGFYSVMVGLGETYFAAFALAIGSTDTFSGILSVAPIFIGATTQLLVPKLVKKMGSYRKWVCTAALVQAISLFYLAQLAFYSVKNDVFLFAGITLYWIASLATNPAWNSWMGNFVPRGIRINFFAYRSRWVHFFSLLAILSGGYLLSTYRSVGTTSVFGIMFTLASLCRLLSAYFLSKSHEPRSLAKEVDTTNFRQALNYLKNSELGKVFGYLLILHFTTNIASPYFSPFMLSELQLSPSQFALLTAAATIAKFISLPLWGLRARTHSVSQLLKIGTLGIAFIPFLWLLSSNFIFLIFLQIYGGAFWAAQELGTFLIFFEHLDPKKRASFLSVFSLLNNFGMLLGSILGGLILRALGENMLAYQIVFGASGSLRLIPLALMPMCLGLNQKKLPSFRPLISAMMGPTFLFRNRKNNNYGPTHSKHCDYSPRRPRQDHAS